MKIRDLEGDRNVCIPYAPRAAAGWLLELAAGPRQRRIRGFYADCHYSFTLRNHYFFKFQYRSKETTVRSVEGSDSILTGPLTTRLKGPWILMHTVENSPCSSSVFLLECRDVGSRSRIEGSVLRTFHASIEGLSGVWTILTCLKRGNASHLAATSCSSKRARFHHATGMPVTATFKRFLNPTPECRRARMVSNSGKAIQYSAHESCSDCGGTFFSFMSGYPVTLRSSTLHRGLYHLVRKGIPQ